MTSTPISWQWLAGSAATPFPIAINTPLGGYMARTSGATGTLDPLMIGAFHLEAVGPETSRALTLVTIDAIAVDTELRDRIAEATGLDPATLLVNASHTHSGPKRIVRRLHPIDTDEPDNALRDRVLQLAAETIRQARSAAEPVSLWIGELDASGAWSNRTANDRPNDPRLRLLASKRADGRMQTAIALIPCHPTILGAESSVVSADLAGGIRRAIAAHPGFETTTVLSLSGAAGDISTRFVRAEPTPAEIARLATLATRNLATGVHQLREIDASAHALRSRPGVVSLPSFRDDCSGDPHADMLAARIAMEAAQNDGARPAEMRQAITRYQGAVLRNDLARSPNPFDPPPIAIDTWALADDLALVATPVELFSSLGARIEAEAPFAETLVLGYTNGYAGYVADIAAWDAGTYEALASPYARRAGDVLVEEAVALLTALAADSPDAT